MSELCEEIFASGARKGNVCGETRPCRYHERKNSKPSPNKEVDKRTSNSNIPDELGNKEVTEILASSLTEVDQEIKDFDADTAVKSVSTENKQKQRKMTPNATPEKQLVGDSNACIGIVKKTGEVCGRLCKTGSKYCGYHSKMWYFIES